MQDITTPSGPFQWRQPGPPSTSVIRASNSPRPDPRALSLSPTRAFAAHTEGDSSRTMERPLRPFLCFAIFIAIIIYIGRGGEEGMISSNEISSQSLKKDRARGGIHGGNAGIARQGRCGVPRRDALALPGRNLGQGANPREEEGAISRGQPRRADPGGPHAIQLPWRWRRRWRLCRAAGPPARAARRRGAAATAPSSRSMGGGAGCGGECASPGETSRSLW